ncbi:MAG: hypothetical protein LBQ80_03565 [Clostridium sp.]|nr:hypothetical protein [Clostridium sp.]
MEYTIERADSTVPELQEEKQRLSGKALWYAVLAYVGPLWLLGMFDRGLKHKKELRFHVGQGMILTAAWLAVFCIVGLGGAGLGLLIAKLTGISFEDGFKFAADAYFFPAVWAVLLELTLLVLAVILFVLTVKGIISAAKGKNVKLPIIGKFAFYK